MLALPLSDDTPHPRVPVVTLGLIGACVAVFLWQLGLSPRAAREASLSYGMIPAVLFGHAELPHRLHKVAPWATLVTSMFLHGGWLHIAGNMLYLWLFGRGVERALGASRFLALYLLGGVGAALIQALTAPDAEVPMIGASGAIAGALGAYLVLYPRANVTVFLWLFVFVRLISVPAVILLGLWLLLQLGSALAAPAGEPGVAFWAHVGGFLIGAALVLPSRRRGMRPPRPTPISSMRPRRPGGRSSGSVPPAGRLRSRRGPWGRGPWG